MMVELLFGLKPFYHLTRTLQILEHKDNEKPNEFVVVMTRIRGRCFSFFFALTSSSIMIEILHENAWFLVINKPSGILTQAIPGIESVQTTLVKQLHERDPAAATPFIGIPHRLDRVTSGAMVVARNQRALKRLSDQFASRKVTKIYHAIVPKIKESAETTWTDWMRKVPDEARAELVPESDPDAKQAVLRFHAVEHFTLGELPASLVEIELETGRMHQIRLQFASHGYPILGDSLYGSPVQWLGAIPGERESPIALHARKIEFRHPQNAELVSTIARYPAGWPNAGV
jgi:23S rRNA pseudouridine1911/1915/1917 synthase